LTGFAATRLASAVFATFAGVLDVCPAIAFTLYPPAPRQLRHSAAYGSTNKYRPVRRSKASESSAKRYTQKAVGPVSSRR